MMAALALAGCGGPRDAAADDAWVRLPAVAGRPGAAYFTLHGGAAETALARVTTDAAARAELHESMAMGHMTTMRPLASVPLPAGGTIRFAPGGNHVMLFDLKPGLAPGGSATLRLTFADGTVATVPARLVAAGDPAPSNP